MTAALERKIRDAASAYYNSSPVMSDAAFDALVEELTRLNPKSAVLAEIGAPVAGKKATLPFVMMSLDKIKSGTEKWAASRPGPYTVSDKLDGTSALFFKGKLYRRGTGTVGADISHLVTRLVAPKARSTDMAVRGEIILRDADFKAMSGAASDARSAVNGLVNAKTPNPNILKKARFVAYSVLSPTMDKASQIRALKAAGFEVAWNRTLPAVDDAILGRLFSYRRAKSEYAVDGVVVDAGGIHPPVTSARNPTHAFAFKAAADGQGGETVVRDVVWSSSREGRLTPTVVFDPVTTSQGVVMRKATAHNAKYVSDHELGPGARVEVVRSGDVIPYIRAVLRPAPAGAQLPPRSPAWRMVGVHAMLDRVGGDGEVKAMVHFLTCLGVQGARETTMRKVHAAGITGVASLLQVDEPTLAAVPGVGQASAAKIVAGMDDALARATPVDLMVASNTFGPSIGRRKLEALSAADPGFYRKSSDAASFSAVPGIGPSTGVKIVGGVAAFGTFVAANQRIARALKGAEKRRVADPALKGSVVFSGFRDKDLEKLATSAGYEVGASVTAKTALLVVRDLASTTGKAAKALKRGVRIMGEDAFRASL